MEVISRYCKNCKCDTERYKDGTCKPCKSLSRKMARLENPEKFIELNRRWKERNPEKVKLGAADYYSRNSEKIKLRVSEYYSEHKSKLYQCETERRKKNPEKSRIKLQNRRARTKYSGGKLSKDLSSRLFKLQRGKCACCGEHLGSDYHLDHIMPLALGGTNTDDNIQLLRQRCNNQKHSKHPVEFMQSRGFLL